MDDGNGMTLAESGAVLNISSSALAELEATLDMLDETLTRVSVSGGSDEQRDYIASGIRTAKHHIFQAMRAL